MKLNPSIKTVWILNLTIKNLTQTIFIFLFLTLVSNNFQIDIFGLSNIQITGILFTLRQIFAFLYPVLLYNSYSFEISNEQIILKRGILNIVETHIPSFRLQHIDVNQSWLERMFELSSLIIYTAGTKGAVIFIPGLPLYYSEEVREKLKQNIKEDNI